MEALKFLLNLGYKPQRSFFLAYGHDEEVSRTKNSKMGFGGCSMVAQWCKSILGLNFLFLCFKLVVIHHRKLWENKLRIELNHGILSRVPFFYLNAIISCL